MSSHSRRSPVTSPPCSPSATAAHLYPFLSPRPSSIPYPTRGRPQIAGTGASACAPATGLAIQARFKDPQEAGEPSARGGRSPWTGRIEGFGLQRGFYCCWCIIRVDSRCCEFVDWGLAGCLPGRFSGIGGLCGGCCHCVAAFFVFSFSFSSCFSFWLHFDMRLLRLVVVEVLCDSPERGACLGAAGWPAFIVLYGHFILY